MEAPQGAGIRVDLRPDPLLDALADDQVQPPVPHALVEHGLALGGPGESLILELVEEERVLAEAVVQRLHPLHQRRRGQRLALLDLLFLQQLLELLHRERALADPEHDLRRVRGLQLPPEGLGIEHHGALGRAGVADGLRHPVPSLLLPEPAGDDQPHVLERELLLLDRVGDVEEDGAALHPDGIADPSLRQRENHVLQGFRQPPAAHRSQPAVHQACLRLRELARQPSEGLSLLAPLLEGREEGHGLLGVGGVLVAPEQVGDEAHPGPVELLPVGVVIGLQLLPLDPNGLHAVLLEVEEVEHRVAVEAVALRAERFHRAVLVGDLGPEGALDDQALRHLAVTRHIGLRVRAPRQPRRARGGGHRALHLLDANGSRPALGHHVGRRWRLATGQKRRDPERGQETAPHRCPIMSRAWSSTSRSRQPSWIVRKTRSASTTSRRSTSAASSARWAFQ